jgi:hypothetical protein
MTSKRFVSGAVIVGVLSAVPAFAQEARPRRDPGGDRGGRVEQRSDRGGGERRYAAPRHPGGGSYVRQERREAPARVYQAPRNEVRRSDAPRRYDNRRYDAPRRYDPPRQVRRYEAPRYDARRYDNRRYDTRRYDDRRYYSNRGYAVPRHPATRGYSYRPYAYRSYRGSYGYGRRTVFIRPRIVTVVPWRPYHYRPRFSIGAFYGAGGVYAYGHTPSYYYDPVPGRIYGGVRITDAPREAQVFADGYYVGIVDDFDGVFQHVNLEAGEHRIEIQSPGMDPLVFDVMVQAGRTITLRADAYGYAGDGYYDGY